MEKTNKRPIIIDTDPGIDDTMALAAALFSKELDVQLLTTVAGNVSLEKVTRNLLRLLTFWDLKIPVAKGASQPLLRAARDASEVHGESGLAGFDFPDEYQENLLPESAVAAMKRVLMAAREPVTIVALAPLTNIALLLREYPEFKEKIAEIVLMGGAFGRGNFGAYTEFNIGVDPEAARIVFDSGLKLTMVPLEMGSIAKIYPEESQKMANLNQTGQMLYSLLQHYRSGSLDSGLEMYDSTAIAYLLNPSMFTVEKLSVQIETQGEYTAGATIVDFTDFYQKPANCQVCVNLDSAKFSTWLLTALTNCP
ncbi:ribonucleoside hydrolase RihC [Enterococcus sp. LJL90]